MVVSRAATSPWLTQSVLVGPSVAKEQNLVTAGLFPVACWRVDDVRFDFDSSFVLPAVAKEIAALAKLREAHKRPVVPRTDPKSPQFIFPPLSIFGHADPVGQDDYNKFLSGRRAAAIYGMLTRRDEVWEDLYSNKGVFTGLAAGDKWGARTIQTMLTALGFPPGKDDKGNPDATSAVRSFQSSQGLLPDGNPGQQTRKKLFLAYMDKLCGTEFKLDKEDDFLARGKDSAGKGDFQGCGEFNPILVFSEQQNQKFEQDKDKNKTARNVANVPNRRVMVLLFRPGSKVLAAKWPCPKAKEGVAGCKKRFWSDGESAEARAFPMKNASSMPHKTLSAAVYRTALSSSPCERALKSFPVRLYDGFGLAIPFAPFVVAVSGGDFRSEHGRRSRNHCGAGCAGIADYKGKRVLWEGSLPYVTVDHQRETLDVETTRPRSTARGGCRSARARSAGSGARAVVPRRRRAVGDASRPARTSTRSCGDSTTTAGCARG